MTSDLPNYHREYSLNGSYSIFQFERSDVISVLKNSIEYSFMCFKCLIKTPRESPDMGCPRYISFGDELSLGVSLR